MASSGVRLSGRIVLSGAGPLQPGGSDQFVKSADGVSGGEDVVTDIRSGIQQSLCEGSTVIRFSAFVVGAVDNEDG